MNKGDLIDFVAHQTKLTKVDSEKAVNAVFEGIAGALRKKGRFLYKHKKEQERLVLESGLLCPILRPTLMFGWFDRKHLGWLSRFMQKVPVFPIPGQGRYLRQPLYEADMKITISCIEGRVQSGIYNISGHEKIDYIDIIRTTKRVTQACSILLKTPYRLFYALL